MVNNKENQEKLTYNNKNRIVYAIIFSIILIPSIRYKVIPSFRIEQVIVILFTIYMYCKLTFGGKIKKSNMTFPFMYLGFSFFIILSILIGSFKGIKVVPNDFFEIYKIYIYLGIYLITLSMVKNKEDKIKIIKFMILCILISVLISIQQYFNLFNLNERYVHIIAPTQFRTLVNNYPFPRVVGMTSNPNEYSVMPSIGAILSWGMYSITKKKKNLIYMMICIFGVLLTMSRSGFVFMASGIAIFTFLYSLKPSFSINNIIEGRINLKALRFMMFSIVILTFIGIVIFNYLPQELTWRLMSGVKIKSDNSFQARVRNWKEHITYFKMSPIFGIGPAKSIEYEKHVDNEWLLFLRRYGIVGCSYIVFIFVFPFIKSNDKFFKYIYFSVLIGSALYMIPAIIYNSFQIMPLIMILAGLVPNNNKTSN